MSEKVETVKAEDATVKSEDNKVTLTKQEVNKSWWIWFNRTRLIKIVYV